MINNLFAYVLITTSLLAAVPQPQGKESPRLFDKFGETSCEMIDLYLSEYAIAIRKEPAAQAYVICYSGQTDSVGKIHRYMSYIQGYVSDLLQRDSRSVSVVNGGSRDNLSIDLWIVPEGTSTPTPTPSTAGTKADGRSIYKFDEAEASIMEYNKESYLTYGLLCTLPFPEWKEFFRILRDELSLRGHIIIYVGHEDRPHYARRIENFLRANLRRDYSNQVEELTTAYGGKREWSQIEIWLVPKGKPNPKPTPRIKSSMTTKIASNNIRAQQHKGSTKERTERGERISERFLRC